MAFAVRSIAGMVGVLALVACSGASNQDLFDGTSEANDTSATDPSRVTTPSPTPTPAGSSSGSPTSQPIAADAGTPPAPTPPAPTCTPELEPNNDPAHATPFKSSICGKIDSAADVDYVSFVVPKDADAIDVKHSEKNGKAVYRYFLGSAPLGSDPSALDPIPGATYVVQIRLDRNSSSAALPSYELDVSFK